jgi:hypothetical protein
MISLSHWINVDTVLKDALILDTEFFLSSVFRKMKSPKTFMVYQAYHKLQPGMDSNLQLYAIQADTMATAPQPVMGPIL